jgi:hypothetical protein
LKIKTKILKNPLHFLIKIMNFLKRKVADPEKKIIVAFTLKIPESDLQNPEFAGFKIMDGSEILQKSHYNPLNDSRLKKFEYIAKEIISVKDSILIYNTGFGLTDFPTISEMLKPYNLTVNKIFLPNESKRNQQLVDGQKAYWDHNRWLNFYPGEIEDLHEEFEREIKSLKARYENTGTEIVEI